MCIRDSNEVIAPDIRLLTVVWPDRDHAPHAGQFFTLRSWGADEAPFLSRPISVHRWNPDSSTIEFLYQVVGEGCLLYTSGTAPGACTACMAAGDPAGTDGCGADGMV